MTLTPERGADLLAQVRTAVGRVVVGQDDVINDALVVFLQAHAAYAGSGAAHRTHFGFVEAHSLAIGREQHDIAGAMGELHIHQAIAIVETDRPDASRTWSRIIRQRSFLDSAIAGGERELVMGCCCCD